MEQSQLIKNNKGFVILFAVTISAILLSIALGVANIAQKEIKFGTSAKETNNALFAADAGIECALFYDKSAPANNAFTGTASMTCGGGSITPTDTGNFWSFALVGLGSGQSCAKVTVDKRIFPITTIISKGFNVSNNACSSVNPNQVERELKVSYRSGAIIGSFAVDSSGTLTNGLAAYWKLNEASGTRTDSFAGNNLSDNNGVSQAAGVSAGTSTSAGFNSASSQFLSSASTLTQVGDSSFTFAGWFYLNSNATYIPFGKDSGVAGQREFRLRHLANRFDFAVFRPGDTQVTITSPVNTAANNWYFVVVWHDAAADTLNISVNNSVPASQSTGGSLQITTNGSLFTVGSRQFPGSQSYLNGRIDEFGFWRRVLTVGEITNLYNGGSGNTYNP
ncbi:MAG: LamG domain-containing protein [Minisyncoccia bacterium]